LNEWCCNDFGRRLPRATGRRERSNTTGRRIEQANRPGRIQATAVQGDDSPVKGFGLSGVFGTLGSTIAQVLIRAGAATTIPGIVAGTMRIEASLGRLRYAGVDYGRAEPAVEWPAFGQVVKRLVRFGGSTRRSQERAVSSESVIP
jgi:hypothetical protein